MASETPLKPQWMPEDTDGEGRVLPARRRRSRRILIGLDKDERERLLDELAYSASPTFDFFLFSLVCGAVFSIGLYFNSPAILLLAALLAPPMLPILGISIGLVTGASRFFQYSFGGFIIASCLVFLCGLLSGWINSFSSPVALNQAQLHARFSWEAGLVLVWGAIWMTRQALRKESVVLPSAAVAYSLYLPLCVAGFGVFGNVPHLFPDGLVVFLAHLSLGIVLSAGTLFIHGYRPLTLFGYTIGTALALLGLVILIGLSASGAAYVGRVALPTYTPTLTPTNTPTTTPTLTPKPPTLTPTHTPTLTHTPTVTLTPSLTPTPLTATVKYPDGAKLRAQPVYNSEVIALLANGASVELLGEQVTDNEQRIWLKVRTRDQKEGWIWQALLVIPVVP